MEAVELFLCENSEFEVDRSREKFLVSFNPRGFLRKRGSARSFDLSTGCGFLAAAGESRMIKPIDNDRDSLILFQEEQIRALERELAARNNTLESVLNSKGWRLLNRYREARARLRSAINGLPAGQPTAVSDAAASATGIEAAVPSGDIKDLYLNTLKKCLTFMLYAPEHLDIREAGQVVRPSASDIETRIEGHAWPLLADTMIGLKRLENLQFCAEDVLARNVPGDMIECGVWRGGACIFLRAVLKAHNVTDRDVWVADSFQGLPAPRVDLYPADREMGLHLEPYLAVSLEQVQHNFSRYGLLDRQVRFLKGWFRDSLPSVSDRKWALIRLDGDMYQSTWEALTNLYPNLAPGGYIIIDDYGAIPACRQAVHDYRQANKIEEELRPIDWTGVFWQRGFSSR
jgi:hypothetical protein